MDMSGGLVLKLELREVQGSRMPIRPRGCLVCLVMRKTDRDLNVTSLYRIEQRWWLIRTQFARGSMTILPSQTDMFAAR